MIRKPFAFRIGTGPCAQNIGIITPQYDDVGIYIYLSYNNKYASLARIVLHRSKSIPKWLRKKYIIMSSRFFFYFIGTYTYFILIHGYCCFLWRSSSAGIRDSLDRIVIFFLHRVEIYHLVIVYVMGWVRR